MEAAIFILVVLVFGLVTFLCQVSPWIIGAVILALFGVYLALVLRRCERAVAPLRSNFNQLFQRYSSEYGQTKSGKKFLKEIQQPIPTKKALNNRMGSLVGRLGVTAIRDPATFLLELALIPVVVGVTSLIGKFFKDDKTEEQKQFEAVLLQARYAMDQRGIAYYHGIFASGAVAVGIIVACAMVPPPEFAHGVAASEAAAFPSPAVTPVPINLSPAVEATPERAILAPTPEPTLTARQEPSATPQPTPAFATVAEAQRAALERYPTLSIGGSPLNAAFVARYKLYKQTRPEYFNDAAWPMNLAVEVSQTAH